MMDGAPSPAKLLQVEGRLATCTTCPYCGVGCGVHAVPDGMGGLTVTADKTHPANEGRLCSKGTALGETTALDDRLLAPRIHGRDAGWSAPRWRHGRCRAAGGPGTRSGPRGAGRHHWVCPGRAW